MEHHSAQLSSAASTLDELIIRLVAIADEHRGGRDDHIAADIDQIERSLRTASRKLERLLRRFD